MSTPTRLFRRILAGCLTGVVLAGCAASPTPRSTPTQPPLVDGDWLGHSQALTTAGASPLTQVGDLVADPAGCLSLVGSDHSRQPPTGMVWTATRDCTNLSAQWQASTEFETGTELVDITVLPSSELIAVGTELDAENAPVAGLVAIRDTNGRWAAAAQLIGDAGEAISALAIGRTGDDLVIGGYFDDAASMWRSGDGRTWQRHPLPVDADFVSSRATRIATGGDTIVVSGRGQDDDGDSHTLLWYSGDGGRTWDQTDLPEDVTADFRINSVVSTVDGEGFFAVGSARSEEMGLAMATSDGVTWKLTEPPATGPLDIALPTGDGEIMVVARPATEGDCGVIGLTWHDQAWHDFALPCTEAGQPRGILLADGRIALMLGDELWLRQR